MSLRYPFENSFFDQDGVLGGLAFVVHVERAAPPGHGAVIDHGALFAGYALADETGKGGGLLAIEVGFEAVTDRFVQQHAGPARAEHDFHLAGRSFARVQLQNGLAGCFFSEIFGSFFTEEEVESNASAAAGAAAGGIALGLGDAGNVHAGQGLGIFREMFRPNQPPGCCATRRSSWRELP